MAFSSIFGFHMCLRRLRFRIQTSVFLGSFIWPILDRRLEKQRRIDCQNSSPRVSPCAEQETFQASQPPALCYQSRLSRTTKAILQPSQLKVGAKSLFLDAK